VNLTPLLYNMFARVNELPALRTEPVYYNVDDRAMHLAKERFRLPPDDQLEQLALGFGVFLEPRSLAESLPAGRAGVAVLDATAVEAFLGHFPAGELGTDGWWWEFLPLEDGTYILVPNDALSSVDFQVLLPVRMRPATYQLRRFTAGIVVDSTGELGSGPVGVDVELCQINAQKQDEELPYQGTCEGEECAAGCTDVVVASALDGSYRLIGCNCTPDEG
jgi:hypothetical protein